MDMVGRGTAEDVPRGGPRNLQVIGAQRSQTELGNVIEQVNERRAERTHRLHVRRAEASAQSILSKRPLYVCAIRNSDSRFFRAGITSTITW